MLGFASKPIQCFDITVQMKKWQYTHSRRAKPELHAPNPDCKHVRKAKQLYWRFIEGCAKLTGLRPKLNFCKSSWSAAISVTLWPLTSVVWGRKKCERGNPAILNSIPLIELMKFCFLLCFKELQPWKLKVARDFQNFACMHRAARNSAANSVIWKSHSYNFKETVLLVEQLTKGCW